MVSMAAGFSPPLLSPWLNVGIDFSGAWPLIFAYLSVVDADIELGQM